MTIYTDEVALASGTTADTNYGTNATVTLNSKAKRVLGIVNCGVDQTYTTAEGGTGILRLVSDDLGIGNQRFTIPPYTSSGPATNASGQAAIQDFIPLAYQTKGNERIVLDISQSTTVTTARLHEVSVQYSDGNVPQDILERWPLPVPFKGGETVNAQQLTTTETALTAITVPAWAKEIVACKPWMLKTGAITAGEEVLGFFRLTSTIADIGVQEYPCNALGATLGTPVGTGMSHDRVPWIPMHIPMTGKNETITPSVNLRTAVTAGNRVGFSLAWR